MSFNVYKTATECKKSNTKKIRLSSMKNYDHTP